MHEMTGGTERRRENRQSKQQQDFRRVLREVARDDFVQERRRSPTSPMRWPWRIDVLKCQWLPAVGRFLVLRAVLHFDRQKKPYPAFPYTLVPPRFRVPSLATRAGGHVMDQLVDRPQFRSR